MARPKSPTFHEIYSFAEVDQPLGYFIFVFILLYDQSVSNKTSIMAGFSIASLVNITNQSESR